MNNYNNEILLAKKRFYGIEEGFKFLDLSLNLMSQLKKEKVNPSLYIFDYRKNETFGVNVNNKELYKFLQDLYIDFLIKEKFQKYGWYVNFCETIYKIFAKNLTDQDKLSDVFIKIFSKGFIFLSNIDNKIEISLLRKFVLVDLVFLTNDTVESLLYFEKIFEILVDQKILLLFENYISINDSRIYYDFLITSLNIPYFFSENEFDLKFGCKYNLNNLLNVIDFYLLELFNTSSFAKVHELFSLNEEYKECFSFLMNYEDSDISRIPLLPKPLDNIFDMFLLKKLILNEYCFHIIVISCFDYYCFNPLIKNILTEKSDFRFKFNSLENIFKIIE